MRPQPRQTGPLRGDLELLPMINVVFLLLMFFLLGARLEAPAGDAVTLPELQIEAERAPDAVTPWVLSLREGGVLQLEELTAQDAILARLASDPDRPLRLRADAGAGAQDLARLLTVLPSSAVLLEVRPLP